MKEKIIKSKLITKYMEENNVEEDTFCKLCNITKKEFNQVMTDDLELDITVILKVADLIKEVFVGLRRKASNNAAGWRHKLHILLVFVRTRKAVP